MHIESKIWVIALWLDSNGTLWL